MATILVVEDEVDINNLIRTHLESEGHTIHQAFDGRAALELVEAHAPHLVILDWMLPGMDGLAVCRQLRRDHLMPIIMLTARSEEIDRLLGLEVGADDYISKPFSIRELVARVRAILRRVALDSRMVTTATTPVNNASLTADNRAAASTLSTPQPIHNGPLHIDAAQRIVTLNGSEIELTPTEFDLLVLFASHPGRAFSREFLLKHIWGYEYDGFDRTVDSHIARLRKKLGILNDKIVTVWGVGYRFVA
jgi:DNA-binding response OmpR family regulator